VDNSCTPGKGDNGCVRTRRAPRRAKSAARDGGKKRPETGAEAPVSGRFFPRLASRAAPRVLTQLSSPSPGVQELSTARLLRARRFYHNQILDNGLSKRSVMGDGLDYAPYFFVERRIAVGEGIYFLGKRSASQTLRLVS